VADRRRSPAVFTMAELDGLVRVCPDPVYVLLGSDCGLRVSEICRVCPDDIDAGHPGWVHVVGKGNLRRVVPMTRRLGAAIREEDIRRASYGVDDAVPYVARTPRTVRRWLRRDMRAAGIVVAGRSVHTLRHSYATRMVDAGVGLQVVQALMGHADMGTTAIYLHSSVERLARAAEALDSWDVVHGSPRWVCPDLWDIGTSRVVGGARPGRPSSARGLRRVVRRRRRRRA